MRLSVISFNIWDLPIWGVVKNRAERIRGIAKYLKTLDADIVCLQESWDPSNQIYLHEQIGPEKYFVSKSGRGTWLKRFIGGTGGLLTFSKYPILSDRFIPFGFFNYAPQEMIGRKGGSEIVVQTPAGLIRIINVHLHQPKPWGTYVRLNQLARVFKGEQEFAHIPTIFCGDFNEHAILSKERFLDFFTSRGFIHPTNGGDSEIPSYRKENPMVDNWINRVKESKRIDYIFVKDLERLNLRVLQNKPAHLVPALSDHDPVILIAN